MASRCSGVMTVAMRMTPSTWFFSEKRRRNSTSRDASLSVLARSTRYPASLRTSVMPATMRLTEAELILGMMTPTTLVLPVRRALAWLEGT